jgi:hypothetical protein
MLALDEPGENDGVVHAEGFSFIVEKGLLKELSRIRIDSNEQGFLLTSSHPDKGLCLSSGK